jgi:hypothetical protein
MNTKTAGRNRWVVTLVISSLLIAAIACAGLGGDGDTDIEATRAALEATQAALSTQAAEVLSGDETPSSGDQGESTLPPTGDAQLTVTNDSSEAICFLYVSLAENDNWGEDQLGESGVIASGDSFIVYEIPSGSYDIMAEMCDGDPVVEEGVLIEGEYYWNVYDASASEGYWVVTDDYNSIQLEAPLDWSDYDGSPWYDSGDVIGAQLIVSPDVNSFLETWSTPGVIFSASDDLARLAGYLQLLNYVREDFMAECEYDGRFDYEDALYRGKYDLFNKCGGPGGADYMILSAVSIDDQFSYLILVEVQMVSDTDKETAQHILDTFQVIGQLP